MLAGMVIFPPSPVRSGTQVYSEAGSYSFTVPIGVGSITIETSGGAGGGASGWTAAVPPSEKDGDTTYVAQFGGDGGSAATATSEISVTPLSTVSIVVGAGGAGGIPFGATWYGSSNANPGEAGEDTSVTYAAVEVIRADAGEGGQVLSDGAGGLASASTGDTKTNGVAGDGGAGGFGRNQSGTAGIDGTVTITW